MVGRGPVASQSRDVVVRFVGDTGNLTKGADQVSGRLRGVASSLQGIATLGAVVGAVSFFKSAIEEAREAERVTRKTEAVIRSTGGAAGVTAKQVSELAGSLSEKVAVDDEVIQHGENVLMTFTKVRNETGKGNDIFNQATEAALNMSAALSESGDTGADLQSNVTRLGKALNDPLKGITALTKAGVVFDEGQKQQIKTLVESGDIMGAQKIILSELQTEFGGMAEASADSMGKASVSWGNFAESVGQKVMPAVHAVSNWALHTGLPALGQVADTAGDLVAPAFRAAATAGGELVEMWQGLPGPIQAGAVAMGAWMLVGDRVSGFFGRTTGPLKTFGSDVQTVMTASQGSVGRFGASMQVLQDRIPVMGAMGASFRNARGDVTGFGGAVRGVAAGAFTGLRAAAGGLMGMLGGPWGLAIVGATVLLTWLAGRSQQAEQEQRQLADAGREVAKAIAEQDGVLNGATRNAAAKAAEDEGLLQLAEELGISLPRVTSAVEGQSGAYEGLKSQLEGVIAGKQAELRQTQDRSGQKQEHIQGEIDQYQGLLDKLNGVVTGKDSEYAATKRVDEASKSYTGTAAIATTATDLYKVAIESAGLEFDESAGLADQLREAIDKLTSAEMAQIDTLEGYEAAQDSLDTAVKENGNTLNIHTAAGRANRDALEDVAKKSRDLMQADIDAGMPMNQALKRHNDRIAALRTEATKTFGAKSEAVKLINTYSKVPKAVTTAIRVAGYEAANRRMLDLSAKQTLLEKGMPITPSNLRAINKEKNQQRSGGYAKGGPVVGPGGPTSDDVPLWGSAGEFMQRTDAVNYYGLPFMHAVNEKRIPKGAIQGLARGGMVWPFKVNVNKTKIPQFISAMPAGGAGGAARWAPLVLQALAMLGQSSSLLPNVLRRMNQESGGNPRAINLWDSNAARGTPSIGLMQTIGPTFNAYAGRFRSRGIYDPFANIYAGLNYAVNRYGSLAYAMDKPGGYKNGGWLKPGQVGVNETSKPEAVFTQDQLRQMEKPNLTKQYVLHAHVTNHPVDLVNEFRRMELMEGMP